MVVDALSNQQQNTYINSVKREMRIQTPNVAFERSSTKHTANLEVPRM